MTVAVEHLQGRSLKDALNTLCDIFAREPSYSEITDHILHFVKGFDVLRGYRNFYVHSIRGVGQAPDDAATFQAQLLSTEAKGKLAWINQVVTTAELESFMRSTMLLADYGNAVRENIPANKGLLNALLASRPSVPLPSLEKPQWPETVRKNRNYLQGQ